MIKLARIFIPLFFLGFITGSLSAQSSQALFDDANEQLEEGNYVEALTLYQQLEESNRFSGALFLNMGVTYQRVDSLGKAKYYLLKASHFEETEEKAEQALEFVNTQFSRQSAVLPQLPWDVATRWLQQEVGAINLLLWGIILLNIAAAMFIAPWFLKQVPSVSQLISYMIAGGALILILAGFYTQYVSDRYSTAVLTSEKIPVLEQPREESSLVSQAFEGYTFTVDHYESGTEPGWAYVRMSNGLYGWIPTSDILIL